MKRLAVDDEKLTNHVERCLLKNVKFTACKTLFSAPGVHIVTDHLCRVFSSSPNICHQISRPP